MKNRSKKIILIGFSFLIWFISLGIIWALRTWKHLKIEELIYELSAPLSGTGNVLLAQFFLNVICPLLLIVILVSVILHWKGQHRIYMAVYAVVTTVVFLGAAAVAFTRLDLAEYIKNTKKESKFIEE